MVLFWPALFFIKGDAGSAQEIAQLKGDMDAIEEANIRKKCGLQFRRRLGRELINGFLGEGFLIHPRDEPLRPDRFRMARDRAAAAGQAARRSTG